MLTKRTLPEQLRQLRQLRGRRDDADRSMLTKRTLPEQLRQLRQLRGAVGLLLYPRAMSLSAFGCAVAALAGLAVDCGA